MSTPIVADQSGLHIRVTGADRVRFLQGMCTANVETIDGFAWAAMLTPKARVVSVFQIVPAADHLILLCEPELTQATIERLGKYAIMDDVEFTAVELAVHRVWPNPASVWTAPPVFAAPVEPSAAEAVEIRRIEAGVPRFGVDIGEDYFPFETPLARFIDYEKGCYIGQEPVSRVHFRGAPNKMMRGLSIAGRGAIAGRTVEPGGQVSHADRTNAGTITSAAVSPDFGSIALAYLHRSVADPGTLVTVSGRSATVVELPFG